MAAVGKIQKTRLMPVYKAPGKTNIAFTTGKSGVYLIYEGKQLVYVGYSGYDIYKTCTRHFQRWSAATKFATFLGFTTGVTYYNKDVMQYKVRIIFCSPARAEKLEKSLIIKYQPRDNTEKYKTYIPTPEAVALVNEFEKSRVTDFDDVDVPF